MRGNPILLASAAVFLGMLPAAKTTAQDTDWSRGTGWPPFPNLEVLALDPEVPTTIWAGGTQGPGLFRSLDAGRSWLASGSVTSTAIHVEKNCDYWGVGGDHTMELDLSR
jgi:hypothetical protein